MVMGNNCKYFSGSIPNELLAARIYDRFAFQHFGLRSKINLNYTRKQLLDMIEELEEQVKDQLEAEAKDIQLQKERKVLETSAGLGNFLYPSDLIVLKGRLRLDDI